MNRTSSQSRRGGCRLFLVDSFTSVPFAGNPAGVVLGADHLEARDMQAIARELQYSETAFVCRPQGLDHHVFVRFFTPTTEVPSCGHATLATHFVLGRERREHRTLVQGCGAGLIEVEVNPSDEECAVLMTQRSPIFWPPLSSALVDRIAAALGLPASALRSDCPVQVVSTGHSKVLVPLRTQTDLDGIRPDMDALVALSREIGSNGFHVFAAVNRADTLMACRMFAPAIGIPEDPVTGNGNGPLGAYLVAHGLTGHDGRQLRFWATQGECLGRPGRARVLVDIHRGQPARVRVGGDAVIIAEGDLWV